jgi:hypothetical protein
MNAQKRILATVVGTVVAFFGGWIIWGIIADPLFEGHMDTSLSRGEDGMIWWALIAGNLFYTYLLAYVYEHWNGGVKGFMPGLKIGVMIGLILALAIDLTMYSMSTMISDLTAIIIDTVCNGVWMGLVGGSVGFMYGRD